MPFPSPLLKTSGTVTSVYARLFAARLGGGFCSYLAPLCLRLKNKKTPRAADIPLARSLALSSLHDHHPVSRTRDPSDRNQASVASHKDAAALLTAGPHSSSYNRGQHLIRMSATATTITWPPALETHIITIIVNGSTVAIPAYQTANVTMFPNYTYTTTTTKPPPTTVIGINPPPPFISGSPTSTASASADAKAKAVLWRNWGLVVLAVVVLAVVGGLTLRRYRSGRGKKQEPGTFAPVGEDYNESERGGTIGGGTSSTLPGGSSISLATMGSLHHHHQSQVASSNNNVRERRNSQPIPRSLDLDGDSRS